MTSMTTARALKAAGLVWLPTKGDRFVIPDRDMDGDVFVVSDMTVEAQDLATGQVLGFNGTTEWALDSVEAVDVLWLPREGQLREELGAAFRGLGPHPTGWRVTTSRGGLEVVSTAADAEEAYALALLGLRGTTAAQLLPVAAGALAAQLLALEPEEWHLAAPDGVRTVTEVVAGGVGGLGADPVGGWPAALEALLQAWAVPDEAFARERDGQTAGGTAARVAEAGAEGVLVDLVTATWDVAVAVGQRPQVDPSTAARALEHVRTWPSSRVAGQLTGQVTGQGGSPEAGGQLRELLLLTGRQPLS